MNKVISMIQELFSARKSFPTIGERLDDIDINTSSKIDRLINHINGNIPKLTLDGSLEDSGKSINDLLIPYDVGKFTISYGYTNGKITSEVLSGDINRITNFTYGINGIEEGKIVKQEIIENGKTITQIFHYDLNGKIIKVDQNV